MILSRKLCILKGVYPREPKKRKNPNKVYYLKKDIMFLYHDPIVEKLREQKIYHRKMKSAEGLKDRFKLIQLKLKFPTYSLDHIMRERYPNFSDAIRDLDDALSLIVLIAQLPQTDILAKPRILECERLYYEFESWVARAQALKKVFVSVKGIYYQAEIDGLPVTWLSPHENAGTATAIDTKDVNIKILLNFVELYEAMMGFVLYKLYHNLGLKYPPVASLEVLKKTEASKVENEELLLDYYVANLGNVVNFKHI
jgi:pescadillo protein